MPKWFLKLTVKLVLGHIPGKNMLLRNFKMFRHGEMDDPLYALRVFRMHTDRAYPGKVPQELTFLELGPGDSLLSGFIAAAHGAKKTYLVDVGRYAMKNYEAYIEGGKALSSHGLDIDQDFSSLEMAIKNNRIDYLTNGLESLKSIPSGSVDFIWSHSVLEHVRKDDFIPTIIELCRVLAPQGMMSHSIDLKDHLDKALNNLRFSEKFWENNYVANSGFYTNRLNFQNIQDAFTSGGVDIKWEHKDYWEALPTPKSSMHEDFRNQPDEILRVLRYNLLVTKP